MQLLLLIACAPSIEIQHEVRGETLVVDIQAAPNTTFSLAGFPVTTDAQGAAHVERSLKTMEEGYHEMPLLVNSRPAATLDFSWYKPPTWRITGCSAKGYTGARVGFGDGAHQRERCVVGEDAGVSLEFEVLTDTTVELLGAKADSKEATTVELSVDLRPVLLELPLRGEPPPQTHTLRVSRPNTVALEVPIELSFEEGSVIAALDGVERGQAIPGEGGGGLAYPLTGGSLALFGEANTPAELDHIALKTHGEPRKGPACGPYLQNVEDRSDLSGPGMVPRELLDATVTIYSRDGQVVDSETFYAAPGNCPKTILDDGVTLTEIKRYVDDADVLPWLEAWSPG